MLVEPRRCNSVLPSVFYGRPSICATILPRRDFAPARPVQTPAFLRPSYVVFSDNEKLLMRRLTFLIPDNFTLALVGTVVLASVLPTSLYITPVAGFVA